MNEIVIPYAARYPQTEIHPQLERHRFCVLVTHRQMGKTVCAVNHMIKHALLNPHRQSRYFYIAPFFVQAKMIAWDYLKFYTRVIPGVKILENVSTVALPNGAHLRVCGADNPDALRGTYADGVVLDEYGDVKPNVYDEIIRPMLLERKGWVLFFGTPKGQNQFYEIYLSALREFEADPNGEWWAGMYRADQTGVISPEELASIKASTPENIFRQEYLCDFAASSADCVFTQDVLQTARTADFPYAAGERVAALDVARYGDDSSVLFVWENCGAFKWRELAVECWNGKDTTYTVGRVASAAKRLRFTRLIVDADGVGGGVYDQLKELARDFKVFAFQGGAKAADERFLNKRAETYFALRDFMARGYVGLKNQTALTELAGVTYSFNSLGKIKLFSKEELKKKGGKSPDYADAAMMAAALFKTSQARGPAGRSPAALTADGHIYF